MPAVILGQQASVVNTWVEVYELTATPAYSYGVATIRVLNKGATDAVISLAVGVVGVGLEPEDTHLVEYNKTIGSKEVLEYGNIVIKTGESLFVRSDLVDVEVRVDGLLFNTTTNFVDVNSVSINNLNENVIITMVDVVNAVFGTYSITMVNNTVSPIVTAVKIGTAANSGALQRHIEVDKTVPAGGRYSRGCLILAPDEQILVQASVNSGLHVRVDGIVHRP